MRKREKWIKGIVWVLILVLGVYILYRGAGIGKEQEKLAGSSLLSSIYRGVERLSVDNFMSGLSYSANQTSNENDHWLSDLFFETYPLYGYVELQEGQEQDVESKSEYELILQAEAEALEHKVERPREEYIDTAKATEETTEAETKPQEAVSDLVKRTPLVDLSLDKFYDYNYLLNSFYSVDITTTADPKHIDAGKFFETNLAMEKDSAKPQILIYHTHSQETFVDSVEGDVSTSIVGIGDYLTDILQSKYGYTVIHDTGVYDLIDGELDRNKAYDLAFERVAQILADNPSIEIVIDLHRDGVDGKKFVTEIDGRPTAQIMFVNGMSRSSENGDITYLSNPYIEDNLAFSFQMKLKAAQYYPDLMRNIYLMAYRFNMHLRPRTLLVESGTQLNTVEEERNAMIPLADILHMVLSGE